MTNEPEPLAKLIERFPALQRLVIRDRRRRIPYIQQLSATECGPACLAMTLGYHGKPVRLDAVRDVMGPGRDGVTALAILRAAEHFGLQGRGVKLDIEDLEYLEPGTVLHWEFRHFVVFERLHRGAVAIVDPALGRRRVPIEQFRRSFTGVAVLLEPGEAFEETPPPSSHLGRYVRQVLRRSDDWARVLVTSVMLQLSALALPVLTSSIVDRVVPRHDYDLLTVLGVGMLGWVVFQLIASILRAHLLLQLRTLLDVRMTLGFLEHLMALPYAFFQRRQAGDLITRLSSNATIREILTSSALSGVLDGALVSIYLILVFLLSSTIGFLVLVLGLLQLTAFAAARKRQHDLLGQDLQVQSRLQSFQIEMLAGVETLKVMGRERRAVERWTDLFVEMLNVSLSRGRVSAIVDSVLGTLRLASPVLVLVTGTVLVLDGRMTLGTMLGVNALAAAVLGPISSLIGTANQLQFLGIHLERIEDVLETPPEQAEGVGRLASRLKGGIALDNVSFRYDQQSPLVVKDVSLEIEPGQFVAIVGRSGSGKSTLASLIVGLYTPSAGRVLYDGADLAELDLRSVRQQLGIVTQRPYIFGGTIRSNIALTDPEMPIGRVVQAARYACIHDEVTAMPMGYDTLLVDAGSSLSGGQRQRIALARALAGQPAIVLLDEATSALDTITEELVHDQLAKLRCTRVVIAHRLSTVVGADTILVMHEGHLVERGKHQELLVKGGIYKDLIAAQLRGSEGLADSRTS